MLIDVHGHLCPEVSEKVKAYNEAQIHYAQKAGIDKLIVSSLGTWGMHSPAYMSSMEDVVRGNRFVYEKTRQYPGFLYGYCYLNPIFGPQALEELRHCVEELGLVGIKLGGALRASDPDLHPLVERAIEYDIPILHHVYQHRVKEHPNIEVSDPSDIRQLAQEYPELKIIVAHIGGGGDWEFGLRAIADCPNVYMDLSGSVADMGQMDLALRYLGPQRLVFGTDLTIETALARLEVLEISPEEKDLITHKNAQRLFGGRLR